MLFTVRSSIRRYPPRSQLLRQGLRRRAASRPEVSACLCVWMGVNMNVHACINIYNVCTLFKCDDKVYVIMLGV